MTHDAQISVPKSWSCAVALAVQEMSERETPPDFNVFIDDLEKRVALQCLNYFFDTDEGRKFMETSPPQFIEILKSDVTRGTFKTIVDHAQYMQAMESIHRTLECQYLAAFRHPRSRPSSILALCFSLFRMFRFPTAIGTPFNGRSGQMPSKNQEHTGPRGSGNVSGCDSGAMWRV